MGGLGRRPPSRRRRGVPGMWNGEVLGMRVNFDKALHHARPGGTVFGLASIDHDPERLLGGDEVLGITCALIRIDHPGVDIGRRHFPSTRCG